MKKNRLKKPPKTMYFRHWSRKGYGVFQTQGKQVAIATMVMATSLVFETRTATAQVDSSAVEQIHELDEVIVSGEQEPVTFSKMARIVTVMNQEEIAAAPVTSLNELLEYAVSLDIKQRGQHGVQADIAMRGGTFDQTLILLNGVNITDPQTGHHNLNLPLSLSSIDRIEVLEGPASRMFGVNAYNGAINIITNAGSKSLVRLEARAGQHAYLEQQAGLNYKKGKINHYFTAEHKQSNGYLEGEKLNNTDFSTSSLFYHGKWKQKNDKFEWQAGYNTKAFGANSFYTPAYPEQFEATQTFFSSIRYTKTQESLKLNPVVYFRRHHDRFELFRDTAPDWYTSHNYHMTDVAGGHIPLLWQTPYGNLSLNTKIRYAHIYSNVLGKPMSSTKPVPGENANFDHQDERIHGGAQLTYTLDLEKFHLAAGIMTSYYNVLERTRTYPGVEASYELLPQFRIFGSYNEALRLPTFTDLYYAGPTNVGNPDLKPEEAATWESGLKYVNTLMSFQGAFFYRQGKNNIEWIKPLNAAADDPWQAQNLTRIDAKGVDLAMNMRLSNIWKNSPLKRLSANYAYTELNASGEDVQTKYVADNLKHKLSIRLDHRIIGKLAAGWGIQYQDRNGSYTDFTNGTAGNEVDFAPYWLLNLRLAYNTKHKEFFMDVTNLLDQTYTDIANVPQPGRWVQVGARFQITY